MRVRAVNLLRGHFHVLLIVPLVIILMTWPTFARIFETNEFWLHTTHTYDAGQKLWDAWHLERVLTGKSDYFYTDAMFNPRGVSLAFHAASAPHALMLLALQQVISTDDAYNLLYLLMLCFNAFCAYLLIHQLLKDRWIALFGAVVVGVNVWFTDYVTSPDLLLIGTLPLTLYCLHRSVMESRWRFAALAGICGGFTAFIGVYTFVFVLMTVGIYAIFLSVSHWRQSAFWLRLTLFAGVCASISIFRVYPMLADAAVLNEGVAYHLVKEESTDVLNFLILSRNPITGDFLHSVFNAAPDTSYSTAYLGYINLVFLACAVFHAPLRRRLAPWLVALVFFAVLRLGHYLTFNGLAHTSTVLPESVLSNLFPTIIGSIGKTRYFQIGVIIPLAVLSCYGLSVLLKSKRAEKRVALVLLSMLVVAVEYYFPREGTVLERERTLYIDWLQSEDETPIKLINLPQSRLYSTFYLYFQSLSDYPTAFGYANRNPHNVQAYINRNLLLRSWGNYHPVACLPSNKTQSFTAALDELLQTGFTHIVLHHWLHDEQHLVRSFFNVPAAYDDGNVSVYRLADMRLNCEPPLILPPINRFVQSFVESWWDLPEEGLSVVSYHPSESIDQDSLAYLGWLLSDWDSVLHLYMDNDEWMMQSAGQPFADVDESVQDSLLVYLLYDASHGAPRLPNGVEFRDGFNLCQRETHSDNAVIELYLSQRFSCTLIASSSPLRVEYDNGAVLENLLYEFDQDYVDLQFMWRNLPSEAHSISVQFFDAAGNKLGGQDYVVGHAPVARHLIEASSLPSGDYVVKLIFYNFRTGKSVPGTVSSDSTRFGRELDVTAIRKR